MGTSGSKVSIVGAGAVGTRVLGVPLSAGEAQGLRTSAAALHDV